MADGGDRHSRRTGICGEDGALYREILAEYISCIGEQAQAVEDALAAEDIENFTIMVHSLKSTSRTIGAQALSDRARELKSTLSGGIGSRFWPKRRKCWRITEDCMRSLHLIVLRRSRNGRRGRRIVRLWRSCWPGCGTTWRHMIPQVRRKRWRRFCVMIWRKLFWRIWRSLLRHWADLTMKAAGRSSGVGARFGRRPKSREVLEEFMAGPVRVWI